MCLLQVGSEPCFFFLREKPRGLGICNIHMCRTSIREPRSFSLSKRTTPRRAMALECKRDSRKGGRGPSFGARLEGREGDPGDLPYPRDPLSRASRNPSVPSPSGSPDLPHPTPSSRPLATPVPRSVSPRCSRASSDLGLPVSRELTDANRGRRQWRSHRNN